MAQKRTTPNILAAGLGIDPRDLSLYDFDNFINKNVINPVAILDPNEENPQLLTAVKVSKMLASGELDENTKFYCPNCKRELRKAAFGATYEHALEKKIKSGEKMMWVQKPHFNHNIGESCFDWAAFFEKRLANVKQSEDSQDLENIIDEKAKKILKEHPRNRLAVNEEEYNVVQQRLQNLYYVLQMYQKYEQCKNTEEKEEYLLEFLCTFDYISLGDQADIFNFIRTRKPFTDEVKDILRDSINKNLTAFLAKKYGILNDIEIQNHQIVCNFAGETDFNRIFKGNLGNLPSEFVSDEKNRPFDITISNEKLARTPGRASNHQPNYDIAFKTTNGIEDVIGPLINELNHAIEEYNKRQNLRNDIENFVKKYKKLYNLNNEYKIYVPYKDEFEHNDRYISFEFKDFVWNFKIPFVPNDKSSHEKFLKNAFEQFKVEFEKDKTRKLVNNILSEENFGALQKEIYNNTSCEIFKTLNGLVIKSKDLYNNAPVFMREIKLSQDDKDVITAEINKNGRSFSTVLAEKDAFSDLCNIVLNEANEYTEITNFNKKFEENEVEIDGYFSISELPDPLKQLVNYYFETGVKENGKIPKEIIKSILTSGLITEESESDIKFKPESNVSVVQHTKEKENNIRFKTFLEIDKSWLHEDTLNLNKKFFYARYGNFRCKFIVPCDMLLDLDNKNTDKVKIEIVRMFQSKDVLFRRQELYPNPNKFDEIPFEERANVLNKCFNIIEKDEHDFSNETNIRPSLDNVINNKRNDCKDEIVKIENEEINNNTKFKQFLEIDKSRPQEDSNHPDRVFFYARDNEFTYKFFVPRNMFLNDENTGKLKIEVARMLQDRAIWFKRRELTSNSQQFYIVPFEERLKILTKCFDIEKENSIGSGGDDPGSGRS